MVKSKKRKTSRKGKYSTSIHNTAKRRKFLPTSASKAKKAILIVIIIAMIAVMAGLLSTVFLNHENVIKMQISNLVTDYYENYYYDKLAASDVFKDQANLDSNMREYREYGFAPITLRDLLYYDNKRNYKYYDSLTKYCDENATLARIYIDAPYERNSYHYDITYACNF